MEERKNLGAALRQSRERGGFGPISRFCSELGVSYNTLGAYERGDSLPDVDFLALFTQKTGADFMELMRLRLAASDQPANRTVLEAYQDMLVREHRAPYGDAAAPIDWELLQNVIGAVDKLAADEPQPVTPAAKADLTRRIYLYYKEGAGQEGDAARDMAMVMDIVRAALKAGVNRGETVDRGNI